MARGREAGGAAIVEPKPLKVVPHLTRGERVARGKAARAEVPRSAHAQIEFPQSRDPVALLEEQGNLELWYAHLSVARAVAEFTAGVAPKRLRKAQANVRSAIPAAEAYYSDNGSYTSMDITTGAAPNAGGLKGIDQGLALTKVTATASTYTLCAVNGNYYALASGPGGTITVNSGSTCP